jgi:hypothetical protein
MSVFMRRRTLEGGVNKFFLIDQESQIVYGNDDTVVLVVQMHQYVTRATMQHDHNQVQRRSVPLKTAVHIFLREWLYLRE